MNVFSQFVPDIVQMRWEDNLWGGTQQSQLKFELVAFCVVTDLELLSNLTGVYWDGDVGGL